jgi:amino acid adenylation domain-containing protein
MNLVQYSFEEQVKRSPDGVAVSFQGRSLKYAELNEKANRLAHWLRAHRVGPEVRVAICVERSVEMVIGILGILKAGGAFVPLDPEYPSERLAYMLQDAGAEVLLTQQVLLERLPQHKAACMDLDSAWEELMAYSAENPNPLQIPGNLAYVIYTSGSTGRPKGVMLTHQGLSNLVAVQVGELQLGPGVHALQFASLSCDASASEIWTALVSGSELHLGSNDELRPGNNLRWFLSQHAIEVATLTPTVLSLVPEEEGLTALRTLVVAGEACGAHLAERWRHGRRLINAYGPTESTVCTTMGQIDSAGTPGIGRAIGNMRVYVLDENAETVPVGVAGELYAGGEGIGRGYVGRADLTAERFVPDHCSGGAGERLYKTGDRVRWRTDGTLEFLGRLDEQVKIRGFRVELGEIEAVLKQHAGVEEAVVVVREDKGEKRLIGYITQAPGTDAPSPAEIRQYARERVPEYMVPGALVVLKKLPLTSSGKLDRQGLPDPVGEGGRPELETSFVAPRTAVEETLAGIWRELLHLEQVGVHDNFFDLGGHSLLLMQIAWKIEEAFSVEVSLSSLFTALTIEEMTVLIAEQQLAPQTETNVQELFQELSQMAMAESDPSLLQESMDTKSD